MVSMGIPLYTWLASKHTMWPHFSWLPSDYGCKQVAGNAACHHMCCKFTVPRVMQQCHFEQSACVRVSLCVCVLFMVHVCLVLPVLPNDV